MEIEERQRQLVEGACRFPGVLQWKKKKGKTKSGSHRERTENIIGRLSRRTELKEGGRWRWRWGIVEDLGSRREVTYVLSGLRNRTVGRTQVLSRKS